MQQKTHFGRAGAAGRLRQLAGQHQSALETLAFAVMGWLMAGAVILGSAAPFGAAFCAAVSDRQRPAASAAALAGYLFSPAGMKLWNAVVVLMVWLIRWVIGSAPLFGKAAALPSALTFFGYGIVMVMMVLLGGADAYQMMLFFCEALLASGATVIVIEHDLDVMQNADYIIDMGPGGGEDGGRIVAAGTPDVIMQNENSITGKYLKQ